MATQPFCWGPAFIHLGVGGNLLVKKPVFLGTCEDSPQVRFNHEWIPLFNALGGASLSSDESYQGTDALIRLDINNWDGVRMLRTQSVPDYTSIPGLTRFGELGGFLLSEGAYYPMWLQSPYSTLKPAMSKQPNGYRFLAVKLVSEDVGPMSTRPRKISLVYKAHRILDKKSLSWKLYDFNMQGLPPVD